MLFLLVSIHFGTSERNVVLYPKLQKDKSGQPTATRKKTGIVEMFCVCA